MRCIRCQAEIDPSFKACPHCGEAVTDFARRYSGELLDNKYRIVERLGAGGMGDVFRAVHTYLDTERVIKVVRASIAGSDEAHDRFLREARLATKIHHPNVATLHDFAALPDGSHYMVWELIEGENLALYLRRRGGTLPPQEAVDIARQALDGLDAIHRAGIVHRDISPENLMITGQRHLKVIDLGVAKTDEAEQNLTKTGMFVGKLRYASPEHLGFLKEGSRIDGRADLYSLAIVLYEMLTGGPPFEATSPHQYLLHHSTAGEAKAPDLTRVPTELRPALARALERDRERRFPTARAFADALNVPLASLPATDVDATLRLTPEPATIRTPLPKTVIDPAPSPAAPRLRSRIAVLAPIILIAVVAVMWAMRPREVAQEPAKTSTATQAAVLPPAATASATPAQTTIDVTTTMAPTTTTAAPPPASAPVTATRAQTPVPPPAAAPAPAPVNVPELAVSAATYTEGGDGDANSAAVEKARAALNGVSKVTVVSDGDAKLTEELIRSLTEGGLEVGSGADVTIHFSGTLEPLGRGRKRRTAHATVSRHGRTVFRYDLPPEEYRVGDTPAEAFARVLHDVLER